MHRIAQTIILSAAMLITGCQGSIGGSTQASPGFDVKDPDQPTPGELPTDGDPADSRDPAVIVESLACTSQAVGVSAPLRALTPVQYANSIRAMFDGRIEPGHGFPSPSGITTSGFSSDRQLHALSAGFAEGVARAAEETALQVMSRLAELVDCARSADRDCAERFITTYAARAFRRPVPTEDRDVLLDHSDEAMADHGDFAVALAEVTAILLQHPRFLYLPEIGTEDGAQRRLDDWELASRLSYLLWDSPPDEALTRAAEAGELTDPAGLHAHATRLIEDERFRPVLHRFVREWLHAKEVREGEKDPALFPMLDQALATSIGEELERFVDAALQRGPGGFQALMAGRETFVNGPMAALYGIASNAGADDWQAVTLDTHRSGLLTRAAVLAGFAGPFEPSHVNRGRFVRMGLLCTPLPAPPDDALTMQPAYPPEADTRRKRSEILQNTQPCGGCHVQMDPIGLAFDDFDALGLRLEEDVDVSGHIAFGGDITGDFQGSAELGQKLASSETVQQCVGRQWFRYGFGRLDRMADACSAAHVAMSLQRSGGDLKAMFASLVTSDGFRFRTLAEE